MAPPKAKQLWKIHSRHSRERLFAVPEMLWKTACEYFDWCDKTPWTRNEVVKAGPMVGTLIPVPAPRPYSLTGLCVYTGASQALWREAREGAGEELRAVMARIEEVVETQQFEGASIGAFSASVIARKPGCAGEAPEAEAPARIVFEVTEKVMPRAEGPEDSGGPDAAENAGDGGRTGEKKASEKESGR